MKMVSMVICRIVFCVGYWYRSDRFADQVVSEKKILKRKISTDPILALRKTIETIHFTYIPK